MTQEPGKDTIKGDFSGQIVTVHDLQFRPIQTADEYFMEFIGSQGASAQKKVALVTGSHHQQLYWSVGDRGNTMAPLPLVFLREDRRWVSVMDIFINDPARPLWRLPDWNASCIRCHATGGEPRGGLDTRIGDLGISCEACHGPGERHVRANHNPLRRYALHDGHADPTIVNPARLPAPVSAEICGSCHGVRWHQDIDDYMRKGFRFRPGDKENPTYPLVRARAQDVPPWLKSAIDRDFPDMLESHFWRDGMIRVSGREFNGIIESPCFKGGNFSCLSCHSLHDSEPNDQLRREPADEACLRCHEKLRGAVEAHSHHRAGSTGSQCLECHMPYTTYGLLKSIRSHEVSIPTVKESIEVGRPNACNLCHLDRTLEWTNKALESWFGTPPVKLDSDERQIAAAVLWSLRGDAGQRALVADAMGRISAKEASGSDWQAPYLAQLLIDPYPAVRYIAFRSLSRLPGYSSLTFDFIASFPQREAVRQRALALFRPPMYTRAALLESAAGVDSASFARLLQLRDDRPVNLKE